MTYRSLTVKINGKTKLKHRHIMEQHLGRALRPDEQVHHKDENIRNNDIGNLEVLTVAQHQAQHKQKQKHPMTMDCKICGKTFTPAPTKRGRAKTCSKACADTSRSITEKATKGRANFAHEHFFAGRAT